MSDRPKLSLESLSVEELMQGLEGTDPATYNSVELWLKEEGYYPGSTRVEADQLYANYLKWFEDAQIEGRRLDVRSWGKVMIGRFKRGRTKRGSSYYISRRESHSFEP